MKWAQTAPGGWMLRRCHHPPCQNAWANREFLLESVAYPFERPHRGAVLTLGANNISEPCVQSG